MADKDILREITDKVTACYTSAVLSSDKTKEFKGKIDALLRKKFDFGLERQQQISQFFDEQKRQLESGQHDKESDEAKAQVTAFEEIRKTCLRYVQDEMLKKVSSARLTKPQVKDEKDNFVISGEGTFKPGSTLREKRTLQKTLFLTVAGDDKSLKFSVDNAHGFLSRPRAREMLISAVVKTYQDPEYAGGTFTLTDGTITDAERIINGLIKAGANCRIAQFNVPEWSQPIKGDNYRGITGHNDKWTHSGAINALDALNKKIAEHNRLLNPSASKKGENGAHVRVVPSSP